MLAKKLAAALKKIKTFMTQKAIRHIQRSKTMLESSNNKEKAEKKIGKFEKRLENIKMLKCENLRLLALLFLQFDYKIDLFEHYTDLEAKVINN